MNERKPQYEFRNFPANMERKSLGNGTAEEIKKHHKEATSNGQNHAQVYKRKCFPTFVATNGLVHP